MVSQRATAQLGASHQKLKDFYSMVIIKHQDRPAHGSALQQIERRLRESSPSDRSIMIVCPSQEFAQEYAALRKLQTQPSRIDLSHRFGL